MAWVLLPQESTGLASVDLGKLESRFFDPTYEPNSDWIPSSVPGIKAQPWKYNYLDGNIADNPPHKAYPDKLIGPMHVSQLRRTKYIAVSKLTDDYLGLLKRTLHATPPVRPRCARDARDVNPVQAPTASRL